jgi:hypothetical protein
MSYLFGPKDEGDVDDEIPYVKGMDSHLLEELEEEQDRQTDARMKRVLQVLLQSKKLVDAQRKSHEQDDDRRISAQPDRLDADYGHYVHDAASTTHGDDGRRGERASDVPDRSTSQEREEAADVDDMDCDDNVSIVHDATTQDSVTIRRHSGKIKLLTRFSDTSHSQEPGGGCKTIHVTGYAQGASAALRNAVKIGE